MFTFNKEEFLQYVQVIRSPGRRPTEADFFKKWANHIIEFHFTDSVNEDERFTRADGDELERFFWALLGMMFVNFNSWDWTDLAHSCVVLNTHFKGFAVLYVASDMSYETPHEWKTAKRAFRRNVDQLKLW